MIVSQKFWEKIYKKHAPKMLGICRRYVSDKDIAEDIMHDAFIKAINKYNTFSGKGSFEGWLRKITINTALMYLRNKKLEIFNNDLIQNEPEFKYNDESSTNSKKKIIDQADFSDKELLKIIEELPEHHKLVFNLHVIDNYPHARISRELNISIGTSKSHLYRARKKIQQLLYHKALEKQHEQKDHKLDRFFLFIIPFKANYIDRLFKKKLRNFQVASGRKKREFLDSINWQTVSIPKINISFLYSNISYWVLAVSSGVLLTAYIFYGPRKEPPDSTIFKADSTSINKQDASMIYSKSDTIEEKRDTVKEQNNSVPIVIKKKVIQRKTITIRDTIKITGSSNDQ